MSLSDWTKGDGAYIEIVFNEPITFFKALDPSKFIVTSHEYNWVPNGDLIEVIKTVAAVYAKTLDIKATNSFYQNGIEINNGILTLAPDFTKKSLNKNLLLRGGTLVNALITNRILTLGGDVSKKSLNKNLLLRDEGVWTDTLYMNNSYITLAGEEENNG